MKRTNEVLTGAAMGAGVMYLLDPDRGRRRRSILRDQMVHLKHLLNVGAGKTVRDLGNRTRGVVADAGSHFRSAEAGMRSCVRGFARSWDVWCRIPARSMRRLTTGT